MDPSEGPDHRPQASSSLYAFHHRGDLHNCAEQRRVHHDLFLACIQRGFQILQGGRDDREYQGRGPRGPRSQKRQTGCSFEKGQDLRGFRQEGSPGHVLGQQGVLRDPGLRI